jgi:DnaK suppressor protein
MPAKKPVIKQTKARKPALARPVARRPEAPARPAAASRKAVAASTAKSSGKTAPRPAGTPKAESSRPAPRAATAPSAPAAPVSHGPAVKHAVSSARAASEPTLRHAQAPETDDGESGEPHSLLAGPRNVQPYVAKRGEQYMNKVQLAHFQQILLSWKRDLMEEVDRTVSHMKDEAANFPDPNDRATQEEEFSLELRTRDRERKLIRKIEEALKRIEDGTYGYCLETGEEIGIKRLEARPVATLSIEAQERRERRERQYGDRDDRYR